MSREVPLLTSEKIKLGIAVIVILGFFFPLLRFGARELYRVIVRDTEGYEKKMDEAAEYYNFKVVVYRSGLNLYNLEVDVDTWRTHTSDQLKVYCDNVQKTIYKIQQKYKMQEEDNQPYINFYVNAILRGDADRGTSVSIY